MMVSDLGVFWTLVIGVGALTGWWVSLRPNPTYRGAASTVSLLIVVMAVLLCILAVHGQGRPPQSSHTAVAQR